MPLLLESAQDASDELLDSIAKQCSAKEMIIVLQDFAERFMRSLGDDEEDADEDDEEAAGSDVRTRRASKAKQVIRIVTLYSEGKTAPTKCYMHDHSWYS